MNQLKHYLRVLIVLLLQHYSTGLFGQTGQENQLIKTIQSEPNTSLHFIGTENQNHKIALQKIIKEY
jgi:hypothetical protein